MSDLFQLLITYVTKHTERNPSVLFQRVAVIYVETQKLWCAHGRGGATQAYRL